jgi:cytochrome c553
MPHGKLRRRLRNICLAVAAGVCVGAASAAGVAQTFEERLQLCGTCHGADGNSKMEKTPSLAGQPELFLTNQMILFRERLRQSEVMAPFAKGLSDTDIVALAGHYSKLAPEPGPEAVDPALAARGAELANALHCRSCHLPDYAGREQMPRLARQRIDYMVDSMIAYRDGKRYGTDNAMNAVMHGVSDADIRALAHFVAGVR